MNSIDITAYVLVIGVTTVIVSIRLILDNLKEKKAHTQTKQRIKNILDVKKEILRLQTLHVLPEVKRRAQATLDKQNKVLKKKKNKKALK